MPEFVRLIQPNCARLHDSPFLHDAWERFVRGKYIPRMNALTMVELTDCHGNVLTAPFIFMRHYPLIVTTTRDYGDYDVCTTFDVDFESAAPKGVVPVIDRRTEKKFGLPSAIVEEAKMHLDGMHPTAV